eukprot:1737465-Rhodomonas_salina.4
MDASNSFVCIPCMHLCLCTACTGIPTTSLSLSRLTSGCLGMRCDADTDGEVSLQGLLKSVRCSAQVSHWKESAGRERDRDTERHRDTETDKERHRHTDTQTQRERETKPERERERERNRERNRETETVECALKRVALAIHCEIEHKKQHFQDKLYQECGFLLSSLQCTHSDTGGWRKPVCRATAEQILEVLY